MPALPAGIPTRGWSDYQGALDAIVALKPVAPAGTRFNYSDVDFIVLGEIVRRVSGQPLETYAPSTSSSRSACAIPRSCRRLR